MNLPNWLLRVAGWATPKRRRRTSLINSAERFEPKAMLSAFIVDSLLDQPDANPGDGIAATASGDTTLRAAVQEANATPGPDAITLPSDMIELSLQGAVDHTAASGDLEITDDLVISGVDLEESTIAASLIDSAFHIQDGVSLTLENLTLQVSTGNENAIVNDGGTLTLKGAEVDEVPEAFPAKRYSELTTNIRHSDLLIGLFQPVVQRNEPLDASFIPPPIFVSVSHASKPDATIAIGTERLPGWSTAGQNPDLQPTPEMSPRKQLDGPIRVAEQHSDLPGETTKQRRRDVVNSLFQERPDARQQSVKPVAGEQPAEGKSETEPRRLREVYPMLLPMDEDGELQVVPENATINGPIPPPLPEPALLKDAVSYNRRAVEHSAPVQALMAGVLLTMVRPGALRRAVKRITDWKNLVV